AGWWSAVVGYTAQMQEAYFAWIAGDGPARWPQLRILFAALAGGAPFQLERLAQRGGDPSIPPNVYLDTSTYGPRALRLCADAFGADRLVYGSDAPVVDPRETLAAARALGVADVTRLLSPGRGPTPDLVHPDGS